MTDLEPKFPSNKIKLKSLLLLYSPVNRKFMYILVCLRLSSLFGIIIVWILYDNYRFTYYYLDLDLDSLIYVHSSSWRAYRPHQTKTSTSEITGKPFFFCFCCCRKKNCFRFNVKTQNFTYLNVIWISYDNIQFGS